jgi:hypothetical protein
MKRSVGVTVIAVLSLLGSILTLLMGLLLVLIMVFVPIPTKNLPGSPMFFKVILLLSSLMYILPAIWGIVTSVGLFRLRNWARVSTIVFSALLILVSGFGGLVSLLMPTLPSPSHPADNALLAARYFMGLFSLALMGIGVWWLVFFTRRPVTEQFLPSPPAGALPPMIASAVAEERTFKRPLSISILAWLMLAGCLFMLPSMFLHSPAVLFTKLLSGRTAMLCYGGYTALNLWIGVGLLRLRPTARIAGIGYYVFGFTNVSVFYLAPGAHDRVRALMEAQQSLFAWMPAWPNQQAYSFDLKPFLVLGFFGGFLGVAVPLYFLITRKSAFERVETRPPLLAGSSSN